MKFFLFLFFIAAVNSAETSEESAEPSTLPEECYAKLGRFQCGPNAGPKKTLFTYDAENAKCRSFSTTCKFGAGKNRFLTLKACEAKCQPKEKLPDACYRDLGAFQCGPKAGPLRTFYTYRSAEGECKSFQTTCKLTATPKSNIYLSRKACMEMCKSHREDEDESEDEHSEVPSRVCHLKLKVPRCRSGPNRWLYTYHRDEGKCKLFTTKCKTRDLKGNWFKTLGECKAACPRESDEEESINKSE